MSAQNLEKFDSLMKNINKIHPIDKTFYQIAVFNKAIMTFKGINNIVPIFVTN